MKKIILFCLLSSFNLSAVAQSVVHAESKHLRAKKQGFSADIEVGLNFVQNVNDVFSSQNRTKLQYAKGKSTFLSLNALNLTIFNESRILNDGFQHFRYGYKVNDWLKWEAFIQGQYNEIIKIKGRYLAGTGPLFKIIETKEDSINVFIGTMYMPEYEEETTDKINRHHRWNNMLVFGWPINDNIDIDIISYYQPDIVRFKDFRLSSEISLSIKIIDQLNFRFSIAHFYDADPPDGIRKTFYNVRNSLTFDF